ncbi:MAG: HAMP domain-containing protein [Syntrophobacteraceae bacterium]|nr:HAMP domain-containing protein [Syntrophobacteraceae bacterium]
MSLRTKLITGLSGLLAIVLVVGVLSVRTSNEFSSAIQRIFRENYDSVVSCYKVKDAVEKLDRKVMSSLWENTPVLDTDVEPIFSEVEQRLKFQQGNVTLPGEQERTDQMTNLWALYRRAIENIQLLPVAGVERSDSFRHDLLPSSDALRSMAQQIIELNLDNMVSVDGQARQRADETNRTMLVLVLSGVTLALVFVLAIVPTIIRPLDGLTRSVGEIRQGNLDLVVNVHSRDEIGRLGRAFNEMATSLRELRRSDRARFLRIQESTRIALDSLSDAVAICSPAGEIELANGAARTLLGLNPGSTIDARTDERIREPFLQASRELRPVRPGGADSIIQVFQKGEERFFLPEAIPIIADDDRLAGVTLVFKDYSCIRELEEVKSGLISTVSHQLKTPLTSIRLAAHVLLSEKLGPLSPKQVELLSAAREDSDKLYRIVESLLDIGKLEAGRSKMQMCSVTAEQLVMQAVDEVRAPFLDKGIVLKIEVPQDVPPVMADELRIQYVFSNLLSNALKHTSAGGRVSITAAPEGRMVRFAVEDTGTGIPDEYLAHIFEKFFRVPGKEQRSDTGLGLAIAKEIIEAHGGRIGVESKVGQGTKFMFTLRGVTSDE